MADRKPGGADDGELLPRALSTLVALGWNHPWLMLLAVGLSCAACLAYTAARLTYLTHRNDLIAKNKSYYQRWMQYVDEFGDDDDMVVVVQGKDRAAMEQALEQVAAQVQQQPERFDRLFYKVDLRPLRDRALLFLPVEKIRAIQEQIQGMGLLLEPPVLGGIDPLFGWRSLSLVQLLKEGERRAQSFDANLPSREPEAFFHQLDAILSGAASYLEEERVYRSPWRRVLPEAPEPSGDRLERPQYFFSRDGELAFLLVRPAKDAAHFTYAQDSIAALAAIVEQARPRFPDLRFGLTGLPVLENDEMQASQGDSSRASWLALLGVAGLYVVVYRGWRFPLITVGALLVGTAWALGWLTLTVGHLNILSSAFAVMLIGMGDYGVLWVTHYQQQRQRGLEGLEALRQTAEQIGPSMLTAALTTALAFYAAMLADLQAVAELGWIAGSGVLWCALSCLALVPPLLRLLDRQLTAPAANAPAVVSIQAERAARRAWLPALLRRPGRVVAASAVLAALFAALALQLDYDHNLLNMQAQHLESVRWERILIDHTAGANWSALSFTSTREEALALKARYEELPGVSAVVEAASLVPLDQSQKLALVRDLQHRLRHLPPRGQLLAHERPAVEELRDLSLRLAEQLVRLPQTASVHALSASLRRLALRLGPGDAAEKLQRYEQLIVRDLADDLHGLRDVCTPRPIELADLPAPLRQRYVGASGKWLVRVFAKDCLWNFGPLETFIAQVRTVDPEATGKPFTTYEGLKAMQQGFFWAGVYALIAMVLVLLLDFGNVRHTVLALAPLALGMLATLGLMALCGASLNPANLIGFPLILGVGADNGVHVLHDFRNRDRRREYRLNFATGRGIMVASLTTILGFGTLMIAAHRGIAGLGLVLTLGVTCCMAAALIFLPALLSTLDRARTPKPQPTTHRRAA